MSPVSATTQTAVDDTATEVAPAAIAASAVTPTEAAVVEDRQTDAETPAPRRSPVAPGLFDAPAASPAVAPEASAPAEAAVADEDAAADPAAEEVDTGRDDTTSGDAAPETRPPTRDA